MKKVISVLFLGFLLFNGSVAGIGLSQEIKQENPQSNFNSKVLEKEKFEINAKYSYIRSYPGGGGIFIIIMTPKNDFSGFVSLKFIAASELNVKLDKKKLDENSCVAELTIKPDKSIEIKNYEILIVATYYKKSRYVTFRDCIDEIKSPLLSFLFSCLFRIFRADCPIKNLIDIKTLRLEIEMINWSSNNLPDAVIKRDELIDWIETEHPEFGVFTGESCFAYVTYPAHLVVEHWTFLYENWELRICFHVMIPPYDWSMLCLRRHGEIDPIFTAKRESDGTTYEIPILDYPIFYGY